jgi:hypothetical protein
MLISSLLERGREEEGVLRKGEGKPMLISSLSLKGRGELGG